MTPDDAVVAVLAALDAVTIPFMLVGSLASNFHGIPRSTRDADLVVQLPPDGLRRLSAALPAALRLEPQGAFEAVTGTIRYLITLAGSPFVCELFELSDDPHDQARFARRVPVRLLGADAFVASAEDMIVTKLRWIAGANRPKDWDDVRNIIAVQGDALDWPYVESWCRLHETMRILSDIRAGAPPV